MLNFGVKCEFGFTVCLIFYRQSDFGLSDMKANKTLVLYHTMRNVHNGQFSVLACKDILTFP